MEPETVSKLDAARRQMNEAIRFFFEQRDTIAIHTLAAAAAQVLQDLCKAQGIETFLRNANLIRPDKRKFWRQLLKASENFFKHADRDPEATHDFRPGSTEFVIFDATLMYPLLTKRQTYEGAVFQSWFFLKYPDMLLDSDYKRNMMTTASRLPLSGSDFERFRDMLAMKHNLPRHILSSFD